MAAGRGRKITIILGVIVVVLVGLFVAADRIGKHEAEQEIAKQAAQELDNRQITSPSKPTAHIAGFPFLTQVAGGTYHKITIHVDKPSTSGITLDRLDLVATDVHANAGDILDGNGTVTADTLVGTASLPLNQVAALLGAQMLASPAADGAQITISPGPSGDIQAEVKVDVPGVSLDLIATGKIAVSDGKIKFDVDSLKPKDGSSSPLLDAVLSQVRQTLAVPLELPALPYGLVITDATADSSGLDVTAKATNVQLS